MKFKLAESRTLEDYFKAHKIYKDWNDFLNNGKIDDMQTIHHFVDLSKEQREELNQALDKRIEQNNQEYFAWLRDPKENPTDELEQELIRMNHIDFWTEDDKREMENIKQELKRRRG